MTARTKSALILLATLLLGLVLGSLITGAAVNRRLDRVAEMRTARGMAIRLERAIQPESQEQREAIRAVLDDAAPAIAEVVRESRERMHSVTDSLRAALEPLLTEEQRARLDDRLRMRRLEPPPGPGDGPPNGMEPRRFRPEGRDGAGERRGNPRPPAEGHPPPEDVRPPPSS